MNDDLEKYEAEVKDLELLAGINNIIEEHKNDPTPRPHRLDPDHPDLVQHDDAPGFWHPDIGPEERQSMMKELKAFVKHHKNHPTPDADCAWCQCVCSPTSTECAWCDDNERACASCKNQ